MDKDRKKDFIILLSLFIISLVVRFKIADFSKSLLVYADEFRYYLLAKSFFCGSGMSINGCPTFYQKILYSLLIAPAFYFENINLRLTTISFINSIVISSGLFPLYFLAKKIFLDRKNVYICLLIYVIFSDLSYSMTFMSEVLFLPLSLCLLLVFYNIISSDETNRKKYFILCLIAGILTYLLYLTKEISLVFILAYLLFIIFDIIKNKNFKSTKNIGFVIYLFCFAFLFILLKLTLFTGSGNSYNQQSFDVLLKPGRFGFMMYSFLYYLGMFIFSLFFFPVILPIINFKKYDIKDKNFFIFLCFLLFLSLGVVAYTVTVREEFGCSTIRFHARYITYLYLLFIIYFLKCFELNDGIINFKDNKIKIISISFLVLVSFFVIDILPDNYIASNYVDNTILYYFIYLSNQVFFNLFVFKIILLFLLVILCFIYLKKIKIFPYIYITIILVLMFFNNYYFYKIVSKQYFLCDYKKDEVAEIVNFIKLNSDKKFLYCNTFEWDKTQKVFSTYSDFPIVFLFNSRHLNSKKVNFIYNYKKYLSEFDYVISPKRLPMILPDNYCEIPLKNRGFRIFKIFKTTKKLLYYRNMKNYSLLFGNVFLNNSSIDDNFIKIGNFGNLLIPSVQLNKGKYQIEIIFEKDIEPSILHFAIDENSLSHKIYNVTNIVTKNISNQKNKVFFFLDDSFKYFDIRIENNSSNDIIIEDILLTKIDKKTGKVQNDKLIDVIEDLLGTNSNNEKVEDWIEYNL